MVNVCFGPPLMHSPTGELAQLRRSGTVDEYCNKFMSLSCGDTMLTEPQQVQLFVTDLGNPLHTDVTLMQLATMVDVVVFTTPSQPWVSNCSITQPTTAAPAASAASSGTSSPATTAKPATTLQPSPVEIVEGRLTGTCFRYNKKFTSGHHKKCKQLFVIEVLCDDYEQAPDESLTDSTISLHALTSIQPRATRTMQLTVQVGAMALTALLNSGSMHNFINVNTTRRAGVHLQGRSGLCVAVANGDRLTCPGSCADLHISISSKDFAIDCYGLSLGSYDMVLHIQCLESLSPILWDFAHRTMGFVRNGHRIFWTTASSTPELTVSMTCYSCSIRLQACRRSASTTTIFVFFLRRLQSRCGHTATPISKSRSWSGSAPTCFKPTSFILAHQRSTPRCCWSRRATTLGVFTSTTER
jgi:hypothetical protein